MGLFSFMKDAGAKLFGAGPAKAATPEDLQKAVEEHGLKADAEKIVLALGNTVGVAQVDNQLAVTNAAADATMYTVQKGDTLWKIAEAHYGKGKGDQYTEIVKANTPPVKNPDLIQPGWVLRIPPLA